MSNLNSVRCGRILVLLTMVDVVSPGCVGSGNGRKSTPPVFLDASVVFRQREVPRNSVLIQYKAERWKEMVGGISRSRDPLPEHAPHLLAISIPEKGFYEGNVDFTPIGPIVVLPKCFSTDINIACVPIYGWGGGLDPRREFQGCRCMRVGVDEPSTPDFTLPEVHFPCRLIQTDSEIRCTGKCSEGQCKLRIRFFDDSQTGAIVWCSCVNGE